MLSFNYKNQPKKHCANNKRQLCIGKDWLDIYWLNFTKAENENQYLSGI